MFGFCCESMEAVGMTLLIACLLRNCFSLLPFEKLHFNVEYERNVLMNQQPRRFLRLQTLDLSGKSTEKLCKKLPNDIFIWGTSLSIWHIIEMLHITYTCRLTELFCRSKRHKRHFSGVHDLGFKIEAVRRA